jgi:uncharacterized protein with ParB-like and HNH nuclease domain
MIRSAFSALLLKGITMDSQKTAENLSELFESYESIRIPEYQRAYSWEEKQCTQFFEDLIEQTGKSYYLGQVLVNNENGTIYIIDGQQRITTSILFLAAVLKKTINSELKEICKKFTSEVFETIPFDQPVFERITQKFQIRSDEETISQKRITNAFKIFSTLIADREDDFLADMVKTLIYAKINTVMICSKIEAAQIFEYQNNRGKELTRFEVIKAYLIHQAYVTSNSPLEATRLISHINELVSRIYRNLEAVEGYLSENEILDKFCYLHLDINGSIDSIKEKFKNSSDKPQWIKLFFKGMSSISDAAKAVVKKSTHKEIMDLFLVGNEVDWKIVLISIFDNGDDAEELFPTIAKNLEILSFKMKLGDFRTDRLPSVAKKYFTTKDLSALAQSIKEYASTGFKSYWNNDAAFENIISKYFVENTHHYDRSIIKYILWQYENHLRIKSKSGLLLDKNLFKEYSIEHIAPQNPDKEVYPDEFIANYLNRAGNLSLLTGSQNSSISNSSYENKKIRYQDTALISYKEIRDHEQWNEKEILNRHQNIIDFVLPYFSINEKVG